MEDLQDALEDAQYFSAMSSKDNKGKKIEPRVNYPSTIALAEWMAKHQDDPSLFTIPNICLDSLGFFLFLKFCCENGDQASALFVEAVAKYKIISAAKTRHKFFDTILREFIDQTLDPEHSLKAAASVAATEAQSAVGDATSQQNVVEGGTAEPKSPKSLQKKASVGKKVAISDRAFEFLDERLCRQWSPCYLATDLEPLGQKHVFKDQWPKPHPCAKPRSGRINTRRAAAAKAASGLLNMREIVNTTNQSKLQPAGSAKAQPIGSISGNQSAGGTPRTKTSRDTSPPFALSPRSLPPMGSAGTIGGASSGASVGSMTSNKSSDTPSKRWRPWPQHGVAIAPEPSSQYLNSETNGVHGDCDNVNIKGSFTMQQDEASDHMAALNHVLIEEGRGLKEGICDSNQVDQISSNNKSDYPNIDPYLSNILPILNADLLLDCPVPRNMKSHSNESAVTGNGSMDEKSYRTTSSVESVFKDGERDGVLWSLSSFDLLESVVFDRLCRKHGPHFLKLPTSYFIAQREVRNNHNTTHSSNASTGGGSSKGSSRDKRAVSSERSVTRKTRNRSTTSIEDSGGASSGTDTGLTVNISLSNDTDVLSTSPISPEVGNEEKKGGELTTNTIMVGNTSPPLSLDIPQASDLKQPNNTTKMLSSNGPSSSSLSSSSKQQSPSSSSVSPMFLRRSSMGTVLDSCGHSDPLMFRNGESNAYFKWLQFQMIKSTEVSEHDFTQFRILGRGGFGLVYGCMHNTTGTMYAMKTMDRRRVKMKKALDLCWNERIILGQLDSPFIVSLSYAFFNRNELYLVMDLMLGGDMGFWLHKKKKLSQEETAYHAGRIFLALKHMHKHHIVYRDLKPQNILLDEIGRTRISDLGLACLISPNMRGSCGTRGYMAPEMLARDKNGHAATYTESVDWFSFGCVLYELRIGQSPFRTSAAGKFATAWMKANKQAIAKASSVSPNASHTTPPAKNKIDVAVTEMEISFTPNEIKDVGFDYVDLCQSLLQKNPAERLGKRTDDIMMHPWFQKYVNMEGISNDTVLPPFTPGKDIHAQSQSMIGTFDEDISKIIMIEEDDRALASWTFSSNSSFNREIISGLKHEKSINMKVAQMQEHKDCCTIS